MSKLSIIKYGFLAAVVLGVAGAGGHFAAVHYQQTMAVVQQKKDAQLAEQKAKRLEKEAREKEREAKRHPQKKSAVGHADDMDDVETLEQEMVKHDIGGGRVLFSYEPPSDDGIYLVPYLVQSADGVLLYVSVRHLGEEAQGFPGVDVMTDEDTRYQLRPTSQQVTTTARENGGVTEQFDELADGQVLTALRAIGRESDAGGVKILFPREGGSNDDRLMTAIECQQIDHMLKLYKLLQQKKAAGELTPPDLSDAKDADGNPVQQSSNIQGEFTSL